MFLLSILPTDVPIHNIWLQVCFQHEILDHFLEPASFLLSMWIQRRSACMCMVCLSLFEPPFYQCIVHAEQCQLSSPSGGVSKVSIETPFRNLHFQLCTPESVATKAIYINALETVVHGSRIWRRGFQNRAMPTFDRLASYLDHSLPNLATWGWGSFRARAHEGCSWAAIQVA